MTFTSAERNSYRAEVIVDELIRSGVRFFAVAPGSRSSLLACALASRSEITIRVHPDERGAAFCALGHARGTGHPAGIVTTSGTAVANLYPAVVEAAMDRIPLLLLTADRPPEVRFLGGNQTIDQRGMFGHFVRWECEVLFDDPNRLRHSVHYATYRSLRSPAGPVHLNVPFDEALEPVSTSRIREAYADTGTRGDLERSQHTPSLVISETARKRVLDSIGAAQRGLIVAGRITRPEERGAIARLAEKTGWPLLADPLSGLRTPDKRDFVCYRYDLMLAHEKFAHAMAPDTVLHFGGLPTSKRLQKWLARIRPQTVLQVVDHPMIIDPDSIVTDRIGATPQAIDLLLDEARIALAETEWLRAWRTLSVAMEDVVEKFSQPELPLSEPSIVRAISRSIGADHGIFVASSLPIRLIDAYSHPEAHLVHIAANRGASGIDGTIASAVGFAHALQLPVTLLIGDLAFLHDLNSLLLVGSSPYPIFIIVLNNDGGGIFHFLPIATATPHFERLFATPHGRTFEHAAHLFDLAYARVGGTVQQACQALDQALEKNRSCILECTTNRLQTHATTQEIIAAVQAIPFG